MDNFHRLQRRVLPYTNKQPVQEVHAFSYPGRNLSFQSAILWSVHSPYGVYNSGQGSKTTSNETGYKDPIVPRRLVGQSQIPPNLSSSHTNLCLVALCRELGWLVNEEKSELEPKQVFNFVGYDLKEGRVRFLKGSICEGTKVAVTLVPNAYHNIRWASSSRENTLQLAQYGSKSELTVPAHPRIQLSPQDYNPFASFQNSSNGKKYLLIRPGVTVLINGF